MGTTVGRSGPSDMPPAGDAGRRRHLLVFSQVYVPDPASVGQYMADAAEALAAGGWRVTVFTADRGYDDPSVRFPRRESRAGVEIHRLPGSSMGKRTLLHRLAGQLSFCLQAITRGIFAGRVDDVLVTTSPPMGAVIGWVVSVLRGARLHFWVMDINPDQAVALGKVRAGSLPVRLLDLVNRRVLARAVNSIVLDPDMAATLARKCPAATSRFRILPPWPLEESLGAVAHAENPFRREHGLEGKFVLMYSGNHSPAHPLRTLLDAARLLRDDPRVLFLFVGGGLGKREVDEFIRNENPPNVRSLPYQPLERIRYSLSAADVHLVAMGESMVGIVHPSKFYGALSLGRPVVLLGPAHCHIGRVLDGHDCGWRVDHGKVEEAAALIRRIAALPQSELEAVGARGREAIMHQFSRDLLCRRFAALLSGDAPHA